ncbi:hypothetical protein ABTM81_20705, partial [Acinetobacter baumannii]
DEILRDRYNVANDGIVIVTVAIDETKGVLAGDPVIQAKGFHGPEGALDQAYEVMYDGLKALSRDEMKDAIRVRHDVG